MAIFNSMVNIMPWNCPFGQQLFYGIQHISDEAEKLGLNLVELKAKDAVKEPVWDAIIATDPVFVCGAGHGSPSTFTGDISDVSAAIFATSFCDILADRVVFLHSCLTAINLGPEAVNQGAITYIGYVVSWTWVSENPTVDPYGLPQAEGFYKAANELPIALVQGDMVAIAYNRSIAMYNYWINVWLTERSTWPGAAEVVKWLLFDRDGLAVLGNTSATIIAAGALTYMAVDIKPPAYVHSGDTITIQGRLLEKGVSIPIPGKTIELVVAGESIFTSVTDDVGEWSFDLTIPKGNITLYILFKGDDSHAPSYADTYKIGAGITSMDVTKEPPTHANIGETVFFSGTLIDKATGLGITGRTITLHGGINDIVVTDANGNWTLGIKSSSAWRPKIYASFTGDTNFVESITPTYQISIGLLPIFGTDEKGPGLGSGVPSILGTTFTILEDGIADSINVWLKVVSDLPSDWTWEVPINKTVCAIYKRSDLSLVAVTDEWEFTPMEPFHDIVKFPFPVKPFLEKGNYILCAWMTIMKVEMGDTGTGYTGAVEISTFISTKESAADPILYENFPPNPIDVVSFWQKEMCIYCEYTPVSANLEQVVGLDPGESKPVIFEVIPEEVGIYHVKVNELEGSFIVK